jgi:hypothetical protein
LIDYYFVSLEKDELDQLEEALRKIDYDVDDRAFI